MTTCWIIWCLIAALLTIFEIMVPSLIFLCFAVGSIFSAIVSYFSSSTWIEFVVFVVASLGSMCFVRPIFKKVIGKSETVNSNVDALIGEKAVVVEKIMPLKPGLIKVLSEIWRAESNVEIEVGEIVNIKYIRGTTAVVER